jgi:hypothetical protein
MGKMGIARKSKCRKEIASVLPDFIFSISVIMIKLQIEDESMKE